MAAMDSSAAPRTTSRVLGRLLHLRLTDDVDGDDSRRNPLIPKKKNATLEALRGGFGCASSASASQALAPAAAAAAVRASADWHNSSGSSGKRSAAARRKREKKQLQQQRRWRDHRAGSISAAAADVWCGPGIGYAAADAPLDCVVAAAAHQSGTASGRASRHDNERASRERSFVSRRRGNQDHISFMDSPTDIEMSLFESDPLPAGHLRRSRGYHCPPGELEEIMLFQTRMLLGGMDLYDQYRDLRLDVDNMTYEELLDLEERIGYVNTGLREEEISQGLRKMRNAIVGSSSLRSSSEIDWKCSICQEEYEANDEKASLECGHSYHICCIKQWLRRKNACPVCKTPVSKV